MKAELGEDYMEFGDVDGEGDALADVDVLCPCLSYMCFVLVSFLTRILGSLPCAEVRMWEFFRQSAVPLVMTPLLQKASSPYKM